MSSFPIGQQYLTRPKTSFGDVWPTEKTIEWTSQKWSRTHTCAHRKLSNKNCRYKLRHLKCISKMRKVVSTSSKIRENNVIFFLVIFRLSNKRSNKPNNNSIITNLHNRIHIISTLVPRRECSMEPTLAIHSAQNFRETKARTVFFIDNETKKIPNKLSCVSFIQLEYVVWPKPELKTKQLIYIQNL